MSKVSVMELVHNGFLYPHETKAVSYCKAWACCQAAAGIKP